jgi:putative flippase GtrA
MKWLPRLPWRSLGRWWIVGLGFYAGGLGILYVFRDILALPLMLGTLIAAEVTTLLRFLLNDRWVFGHARPSWRRLWQYHVACAGGSFIWWIVTNALPQFGVHYLLAATIGTGCSVFFSMLTNFAWIWRRRVSPAASPAVEDTASAD